MNFPKTTDVLNRLYIAHFRSLPIYLSDATPWSQRGEERARETLTHIAEDHQRTANRLGTMILDRGDIVENGVFPMEFTAWHDLGLPFLLRQTIDRQRRTVRMIEGCLDGLSHDPEAKAVAEEILGEAKGHLQSLLDLNHQPA